MKIVVEVDKETLKRLVRQHVEAALGDVEFAIDAVKIETKSKQNYKSEWEDADFRARLEVDA